MTADGIEIPSVEPLRLGEKIELARLALKVARINVQDLAAGLDRDGGTTHIHEIGQAKQLLAQAELALEKALSDSGAERAQRFHDSLPAHGDAS